MRSIKEKHSRDRRVMSGKYILTRDFSGIIWENPLFVGFIQITIVSDHCSVQNKVEIHVIECVCGWVWSGFKRASAQSIIICNLRIKSWFYFYFCFASTIQGDSLILIEVRFELWLVCVCVQKLFFCSYYFFIIFGRLKRIPNVCNLLRLHWKQRKKRRNCIHLIHIRYMNVGRLSKNRTC